MTQPSAAGSGNSPRTTYAGHSDMRDKQQVTVRMTKKFAQDLNLVMASHRLTNVSQVVQGSVAAQADAIRARIAARLAKAGDDQEV